MHTFVDWKAFFSDGMYLVCARTDIYINKNTYVKCHEHQIIHKNGVPQNTYQPAEMLQFVPIPSSGHIRYICLYHKKH